MINDEEREMFNLIMEDGVIKAKVVVSINPPSDIPQGVYRVSYTLTVIDSIGMQRITNGDLEFTVVSINFSLFYL
ncbi:MAG: hypothetical protein H3Z53_10505 [archaeon]|nr:hypothetical protein [archaeon]MCP8314780.1 hypothetical protein [archaeon]MCP8315672.1 hypothetical protein [archaeon]MCP8320495.1 hypothetical protein [archaeon]